MYKVTVDRDIDKVSWLLAQLGWWHEYYAKAALQSGVANLAILEDEERILGCEIFYDVIIGSNVLCVHYYVVVDRSFRSMGFGKMLVLSVEEYCSHADAYIATVSADNTPSMRMFESLCYTPYTWYDIDGIKYGLSYALMKATCGFEDDVVYIKVRDGDPDSFLSNLDYTSGNYRRVYRKICYEPWYRMRSIWW